MKRRDIVKIIELVNNNESVHYNDIAVELGVSSSTAQRYAVLFSKMFKDYVEYRRGILIRKQLIGLENLDPESRLIALRTTLETLEEKLEYVEMKLRELLEGRWDSLNKDQIKGELWDLVDYLKGV